MTTRAPDNRGFAFGVLLNAAFVIAEFVAGTLANSVALIADAAHNLGDVAGLLLAWGAAVLATRAPTERRTYGWRKSTILAALANALLLIGATGAFAWEAIGRLAAPAPAQGTTMIVVAAIGVLVNGVAAWILLRSGHAHHHASAHHDDHDHHHDHDHHDHHDHAQPDLNLRAAFQHMLADAAVSLGVVGAGVVLLATGWAWVDPATSLAIAVVIVASTWSLLRESLALTLDAVPAHIRIDAVREFLRGRPGVVGVHDLHVWALGSSEVALTAHLVLERLANPEFLVETEATLHERFGIDHATLQIEPCEQPPCRHGEGCR
ncbi:cation diffusion facilitator family transporter [Nannocystaceae bacterium ST9]